MGILSKNDLESTPPPREVGYYGAVRSAFEKARSGLEEALNACRGLFQKDQSNIRLERFCRQIEKTLNKVHKLQMRTSRVRDRLPEQKKKPMRPWYQQQEKENPFNPGGPTNHPPDNDEETF